MALHTQTQTGQIVIYAPGLHTGGGFTLLKSLLNSDTLKTTPSILFLDARSLSNLDIPKTAKLFQIEPSITGRIKAEYRLKTITKNTDTLICLHSLPPLFSLTCHSVCFFQNILLLGQISLSGYPTRARIRLKFEQLIGFFLKSRIDRYIVQTESMKEALLKWYRSGPPVIVCPYISQHSPPNSTVPHTIDCDFLYVADGMPHKNHINLIEAWKLLAQDGCFPKLRLTLTKRDGWLLRHLESMREKHQLRIENRGNLSLDEVGTLYRSSRALIFPSTAESLGLPLIEATQHGLPIIAAELDYVRDVCQPIETFDPSSPRSISRAVSRFLSNQNVQTKLFSADTFVKTALAHDAREPLEASS